MHKENRNTINKRPFNHQKSYFALFCVYITCILSCTYLCHGLACWMRLVECDAWRAASLCCELDWATSGWIDTRRRCVYCRQAERPGQPPWTPPELTCESTRIYPSCTSLSNQMNVDEMTTKVSSCRYGRLVLFALCILNGNTMTAYECIKKTSS